MSTQVSYYDAGWRTRVLECTCGWRGDSSGLAEGLFEALIDFTCRECDTILLIVSFPTVEEGREAAERGRPEAIRDMAALDSRRV